MPILHMNASKIQTCHPERSTRSVRSRGISLLLFLLFFAIPAIAQDTIVPESVEMGHAPSLPVIPANELYQNTWSLEHVRHWRVRHSNTTQLELITPEIPAFSMPAKNFTVISQYGMRSGRMHTGIDLRQRPTDSIFAVFDGMVRMAKWYADYGNLVVIRHPNGLETVYSHLSKIFVEPYQSVQSGEAIGLAGRTGRATTDHLHFEFRFLYEHFDPNLLIDFENECLLLEQITFINGRLVIEDKNEIEISEVEKTVEATDTIE
jgi:murein DD-endopeptidase MepM/ murein hydrolase activator NlpD